MAVVAARQPHTHQMPYMRSAVAFNTFQIGTAGKVPLGTMPANSIAAFAMIKKTAAFNAATTNVITIGTADDDDAVLTAVDIDPTTTGTTITWAAAGYSPSVATPLFIKYAQTGTAATTGAATVILFFVPNNDR